MKKLFLTLLILPLLIIGCGQAKLTTAINENLNINGSLLGTSNVQALNIQNMTPSQSQTVTDVSYAVLNNTGGAGTLALANVAYGTACPSTVPAVTLANISIAGGTNVPLTSMGATAASTFNNLINTKQALDRRIFKYYEEYVERITAIIERMFTELNQKEEQNDAD